MSAEQAEDWLRWVYQRLPVGDCHGCTDCARRCAGAVPMLAGEYQAICQCLDDHCQPIPPEPVRQPEQMMPPCRFLDQQSRLCSIYPVRPLICRLFGLVEWLPCPTGKRSVVVSDGLELMRRYAELGPRPFSYWHQQPGICEKGTR